MTTTTDLRRRVGAGIGTVLFAVSGGLFAVSSPAAAAPLAGCQAVEITLHTGSPSTSRCLSAGTTAPAIFPRVCGTDSNDLTLYWNGPIDVARHIIPGGPILCIRGNGVLNLDATQPDGRNWNDQASAWWAGCSSGHFDENAGLFPGQQEPFSGGNGTSAPSGNFDGRPGVLRNDSLTVVTLASNC